MMRKIYIYEEYLGADTALSPEVIAFLNTPISAPENNVKQSHWRQRNCTKLDEYEQAMAA